MEFDFREQRAKRPCLHGHLATAARAGISVVNGDSSLKLQQFVDWKVYNVTPIKNKFGYRVVLIYADGTKIPQQKSGFATKKAANTDRDKTLGELYSGTYVVYTSVKVKDFMLFWIEKEMRPRITSGSYETYSNIVNNHVIPAMGNIRMTEIKRSHIQSLYYEEAAASASIARLVKTVMNTSMQYAVNKKIISINPTIDVALPKQVEKKAYHTRNIDTQKTLNMEQVLTLIEESRETPIHMQVLFAVLLGLRRCEINGVKYSDIDYINRTLKVQRQLGKKPNTTAEEFPAKTFTKQEIGLKTPSSYRTIPIPDYVFEAILEERKVYEKNRRRRSDTFQDLDYICCSTYGRPRSKDFHWRHYKKLLEDNGLPDIRWHDLRSTFCTILLKNNFNPKAVSQLMGHAKEIITIDVYGDTAEIIEDCLDDLQPFIDEVIPKEESESGTDFSEDNYIEQISEFLA